ncbi:MAG: glycosyltransferase family 61 protein [Chitinophagaceae bacterium]|nr:glycosyltransferase family 61 protein [Chitinophagaceae bacterium]MCZ2397312.1 glycosyltransferase family 61 protein [Chitinophagales bacterium]
MATIFFKRPVNYSDKDKEIFYFVDDTENVLEPGIRVVRNSFFHVVTATFLNSGFKNYLKIILAFFGIRYKRRRISSACVFVTDHYSHNYYHWLCEALPKLLLLREKGLNSLVVLPERYKAINYVSESLNSLGWSSAYFSENTILQASLAYIPEATARSGSQHPLYFTKSIQLLTDKNVNGGLLPESKIIFISRQNTVTRRLVNWDEIKEILDNYKVKIVNLENYTLRAQIQLLHSTEILIGVHGAGLTNMCFMKKGASVVEIRRKDDRLNYCYFKLANTCELAYYYLLADGSGKSQNIQQDDLYLPPQTLKTLLKDTLL